MLTQQLCRSLNSKIVGQALLNCLFASYLDLAFVWTILPPGFLLGRLSVSQLQQQARPRRHRPFQLPLLQENFCMTSIRFPGFSQSLVNCLGIVEGLFPPNIRIKHRCPKLMLVLAVLSGSCNLTVLHLKVRGRLP